MGTLSPEAKLADEIAAQSGISMNATLRVFYTLKELGYEISKVKGFKPEPKPESESGGDQKDESAQEEDTVSRDSSSAAAS